MRVDDRQIIELYFARDEQAIKETDVKYGKLCFRIAINILNDYEDSEECVNDTYLNTWNTIPPTRPNNFTAFLCRITRNLSLTRLDFNAAMKRATNAVVSFAELDELVSVESAPQGDMNAIDLGRLISNFLWREKPNARNVFIRKYYFFDSISDIAARYSFSESKVKSMLFHTRNRLKGYLEKEGVIL